MGRSVEEGRGRERRHMYVYGVRGSRGAARAVVMRAPRVRREKRMVRCNVKRI
jgi:hypothetical protein